MKKVTVLGATGSIGVSTLDVLSRHPESYSVYALTAHNNIDALARQCEIFRPSLAVVRNAEDAHKVEKLLRDKNVRTEVIYGKDALSLVASSPDCDIVVSGIVGAAGLLPSLAAAKAGKKILLANKESLVISGRIFIDAVNESGATLLPIDSEHNAIFQCLPNNYTRNPRSFGVAKIILTASGGPFLTRPIETLNSVTPKEAVSHPKWSMGRKISVDSATMMNKGLEVIEAHWLFGVPSEKIEVVVHPQSVIHSMVAYIDGAIIAQLGHPDMRTPIAQALAYPERIDSGVSPLDLTRSEELHFTAPNYARFPCLKLAYDALNAGGAYPAVLNAVNEVAVEAFLEGKIGFRAIENLIQETMNKISLDSAQMSIEFLLEQDERARSLAKELMHYF